MRPLQSRPCDVRHSLFEADTLTTRERPKTGGHFNVAVLLSGAKTPIDKLDTAVALKMIRGEDTDSADQCRDRAVTAVGVAASDVRGSPMLLLLESLFRGRGIKNKAQIPMAQECIAPVNYSIAWRVRAHSCFVLCLLSVADVAADMRRTAGRAAKPAPGDQVAPAPAVGEPYSATYGRPRNHGALPECRCCFSSVLMCRVQLPSMPLSTPVVREAHVLPIHYAAAFSSTVTLGALLQQPDADVDATDLFGQVGKP
jgi:hypothetical protein